MTKRYLFIFILVVIFLSYIFKVDKLVSQNLSTLNENIKNSYISVISYLDFSFSKHINQKKQIVAFKKQILENEKYKILYFKTLNNPKHDENNTLDIARVISYVDFNDFSKVLLKSNRKSKNISALLTKEGYSAGIAIVKNNQLIGYLNHNKKCNYAVYIGKKLIPGIFQGNGKKENITIKHIPIWQKINIDDDVITSGMDNIFYKGIKVGRVIKIKSLSDTQEVIVEPYANVYNKKYFYIPKSVN